MTLSDEELTLYAIREAQLILADYIQPGPRDSEKTINALLSVLDRNDVVEAVDRLEAGIRMNERTSSCVRQHIEQQQRPPKGI